MMFTFGLIPIWEGNEYHTLYINPECYVNGQMALALEDDSTHNMVNKFIINGRKYIK